MAAPLLQLDPTSLFIQTVVNGLAFGSLYALVALGLVLIFKASGVINFANGEMAMFSTFLAFALLDGLGWPYWLAFGGALGLAAGLGLAIYGLVMRPLDQATPLTYLLATVGVGTFLTGLAGWVWNFESRPFPDPVSGPPLRLGLIVFKQTDLVRLGLTLALAVALFAFFRFTRIGMALRGLADNPVAARLMGVSPARLTGLAWAMATVLGAVAGMLVAPTTFLEPLMMSDVALKAFAAAVLGGFTSLPGAVAGGLVLGMADNLVGTYLSQELRGGLAFAVILAVLLVRPNGLFGRAAASLEVMSATPGRAGPAHIPQERSGSSGRGKHRPYRTFEIFRRLSDKKWVWLVVALGGPFLLGSVPGFGLNNYTYSLLNFGLIYALVALGLTLLTGFAGQISLGHSGLLAVGAYVTAGLTSRWDWPFWISLPVAAAATGLVGLGLSLPALRLSGPYLAVVTVGFSVAVPQLLKFLDFRTDGIEGLKITLPGWFGFDASNDLARYYGLLALVGLIYWLARHLTGSKMGRAWLALRGSETVAQTLGVEVARYKVLAFVISAVLTGLAGGLYAGQLGRVEAEQFNLLLSIQFVVMITVGGLGSLKGAIWGAIGLTLAPELVNRLAVLVQDALNGLRLAVQLKNPQYILYGLLLLIIVRFVPPGLLGGRPIVRFQEVLDAQTDPFETLRPRKPGSSLKLEELTVRYGGVTALDNFSMEVRPGEIVGLIGPNGAGKTTAFNCVSRLVNPTSGRLWLGDRELTGLSPSALARLGIARTFQNGGLFADLNVLDNLLIGQHSRLAQSWWPGKVGRRADGEARRQAQTALDFLGIGELASQAVAGLPFGSQKLIELARALVSRPALLLLDEPAAGANELETARLTALIRRLRDELGLTVLLVEHDMRLVMGLCDRLYVLEAGKLLAAGPPALVRADPAVVAAYLGGRKIGF